MFIKVMQVLMMLKLKYFLTELRGFKFVTTLVLEFKKVERDDETAHTTFY